MKDWASSIFLLIFIIDIVSSNLTIYYLLWSSTKDITFFISLIGLLITVQTFTL